MSPNRLTLQDREEAQFSDLGIIMRNIQSDETKKKKGKTMQQYNDLKKGKWERTEKDKVGRQNWTEDNRMGRKLRDKCRNDSYSCFSISRVVYVKYLILDRYTEKCQFAVQYLVL